MHKLRKLKDQLMEELEALVGDGDMSTAKLARIDTLTHALKNLCKIMETMDEPEDGSYRKSSYRGNMDGNRRGYSRADGKDELINHLEDLMKNADEKSRMAIEHCISQVENA